MTEKTPIAPLSQDIQNIERAYRQNVTVVTARPKLIEAFFLAWTGALGIMVLFFLATVGWYGVQGIFQDSAYKTSILINSSNTHAQLANRAPVNIVMGSVQSVATGSEGEYDLFVQIENPNARHAVEFTYSFSHGEGETEERTGFLNPKETAYMLASRATKGKPKSPMLNVKEEKWIVIPEKEVANVDEWSKERGEFSVANIVFARDIAYTESLVSRSTFTITNHTPFSYWEPTFTVRIFRGSVLLGIAEVTAAKFKAGESRNIDMRWFGELPQTATVVVTPRIPYYAERAYMNPEASTTQDGRSRWTIDE